MTNLNTQFQTLRAGHMLGKYIKKKSMIKMDKLKHKTEEQYEIIHKEEYNTEALKHQNMCIKEMELVNT